MRELLGRVIIVATRCQMLVVTNFRVGTTCTSHRDRAPEIELMENVRNCTDEKRVCVFWSGRHGFENENMPRKWKLNVKCATYVDIN
jgi:hypothetical protein